MYNGDLVIYKGRAGRITGHYSCNEHHKYTIRDADGSFIVSDDDIKDIKKVNNNGRYQGGTFPLPDTLRAIEIGEFVVILDGTVGEVIEAMEGSYVFSYIVKTENGNIEVYPNELVPLENP